MTGLARRPVPVGVAALLALAAPAAAQWTAAVMATADARDLAFAPDDANTLYLATHGGGLYASRDRGESWTPVPGLPLRTLTAVAVDPTDGRRILVGGAGEPMGLAEPGGIAVSTDGGRTWRSPAADQRLVRASHVRFDPLTAGRVYATAGQYYWLSTDGGESWTRIGAPNTYDIPDLLLDRHVAGLVFFYNSTYKTAFRSADGGTTWDSGEVPAYVPPGRMRLDPRGAGWLYGLTPEGGLVLSGDGGATWESLAVAPGGALLRDLFVRDDGAMFGLPQLPYPPAAVGGLSRSDDGGATWLALGAESQRLARASQLWFDPQDPDRIWAAAGSGGLLASTDGGLTWEERNAGLAGGKVEYLLTDPGDPDRVWALDAGSLGLWRSEDAGRTWRHTEQFRWPFRFGPDGTLYTPGYVNTVFRVGVATPVTAGGLLRSSDGGHTWEDIGSGLDRSIASGTLVERHRQAPMAWLSPGPTPTVWAVANGGLVASPDNGDSWVDAGLPDEARAAGVLLVTGLSDPPEVVLAATPVGLYRSEGRDFERVNEEVFEHVLADPRDADGLYAATAGIALWHSGDRGRTWQRLPLPALAEVAENPVAFAPAGDRLYAWTAKGALYGAAPTDRAWEPLADPPLTGGMEIRSWTVAAGPTLVAGTNGGGILRYPLGVQTEVAGPAGTTPAATALDPAWPNPFNGSTAIPFGLAAAGTVEVAVFDALGQRLVVLVEGTLDRGRHVARWDGRDGQGRAVASGVYCVELRAGERTLARRVALVR